MLMHTLQGSGLADHSLDHFPIVTSQPCQIFHLCQDRPGPSCYPHCTGPRAEDRAINTEAPWRPATAASRTGSWWTGGQGWWACHYSHHSGQSINPECTPPTHHFSHSSTLALTTLPSSSPTLVGQDEMFVQSTSVQCNFCPSSVQK